MRPILLVGLLVAVGSSTAGAQRLTAADSALVGRLLLAEDQRDTSAAAYADGMRHADARVRVIARRGLQRSGDALFARRDSLPALSAPPVYPNPAWRERYRALGARNDNCAELRTALGDASWHVRLRAADLVAVSCAADIGIIGTLRGWANSPPTSSFRTADGASWHPAAHALATLARVAPTDARSAFRRIATSDIPELRTYAARAAATLNDTAALRRLAGDANDNVKEAAINGLLRVAGHSADDVLLGAIAAQGYQAVRAAARALKESPRSDAVLSSAITIALRLRADSSETSRDARMALVERIAEFAQPGDWPRIAPLANDFDCVVSKAVGDIGTKLGVLIERAPTCRPMPITLPADAVRLALGADVRVRVVLADSSGGGSFVVRLRGDIAPVMAARVMAIARSGWYNGRTWHRVEPNFVIQGPSPGANEYVGFPRFFRDELGNVPHLRGTIGMSTRGHDTGDAQWFVNLIDNNRLNPAYTVFAEIVEGISVADGVLEGDVIARIEVIGQ